MKTFLTLLVTGSLVIFASLPARAISTAVNLAPGFAAVGAGAGTWGWSFTVNSSITVSTLGIYDLGSDGLNVAHDVGLWTSTGTLLTSTLVPAGTSATLAGGFRFSPTAAVTLTPGTYVVGAFNPSGGDIFIVANGLTTAAEITYLTARDTAASGSALAFPFLIDPSPFGPGYFGANFQFDSASASVPETGSTVALLGLAFGGIALLARKRATLA